MEEFWRMTESESYKLTESESYKLTESEKKEIKKIRNLSSVLLIIRQQQRLKC